MSRMDTRSPVHPLRDGGITWVFFFRKSDVPRMELAVVARAERERFLRLAVTFGSRDPESREYRSTTAVHLWQIARLPPKIPWRKALVHVFIHEPLHHAIGRCLAEIDETGDQEWVIDKLGDRRWWWPSPPEHRQTGLKGFEPLTYRCPSRRLELRADKSRSLYLAKLQARGASKGGAQLNVTGVGSPQRDTRQRGTSIGRPAGKCRPESTLSGLESRRSNRRVQASRRRSHPRRRRWCCRQREAARCWRRSRRRARRRR